MWCCFSTLWTSPLSARQRSQRSLTAMETSRAKTQRYKKRQHDIPLSAQDAFLTGGSCDAINIRPTASLKMDLLDAESLLALQILGVSVDSPFSHLAWVQTGAAYLASPVTQLSCYFAASECYFLRSLCASLGWQHPAQPFVLFLLITTRGSVLVCVVSQSGGCICHCFTSFCVKLSKAVPAPCRPQPGWSGRSGVSPGVRPQA